jgi:PAS domain S-box-containing protein
MRKDSPVTIRIRMLILVGIVSTVLAAMLVITSRVVITSSFTRLEQEYGARAVARTGEALAGALTKLNASAGDYAAWDDTYDYAVAPTKAYEETNFNASALTGLDADWMMVFDTTGRLVQGMHVDMLAKEPVPMHEAITRALQADRGTLLLPDSSRGRTGLIMDGTQPVLVALRPILRNDYLGRSRGAFVFGRTLDSTVLARFGAAASVTTSLFVLSDSLPLPPAVATATALLKGGSPSVLTPEGPHTLAGYLLVRDLHGEPALVLRAVMDRDIYGRGQQTFSYILGWLIAITLVFALLVVLILERNVIARLAWLRRGIDNIKKVALPSARLAQSAPDEIGVVAGDINAMLESIEHARQALSASEARYMSLFNQMVSGFALHEIICDEQGVPVDYRFLDVNPAFERLTGLLARDIVGKRAREVMPDLEPEWVQRYGVVAQTGENAHFEAFNGSVGKYFEVLAFSPEHGQFAVSFTDVTDRRKAEEDHVRMQEQLAQAQKMEAVGQLAGGIAHDFNNQLAGVLGYADMLREKVASDPVLSRYAGSIITGIGRAADLTAQLLAFARKGKYLSVPVNMHTVIVEVVALLEHTIDKRIALRQRLNARPTTTTGDPTQLQSVLLNLALNARDAMPQGGELTFATETADLDEEYCSTNSFSITPGRYLRVSVSDTGVGIDAETRKHLFEPFFTTKEKGKGTGMGLAAAYGTVRNHHGAMSVYSEPGKGTTVNVYLPLCVEHEAARELEMPAPQLVGNPRVLLVDDEESILAMAVDMLSGMGCRVRVAHNGREGVDIYRQQWADIDIVVLDMVMPELDGRAAFVQMRAINPGIRAIIASGYSLNGDAQAILQAGAHDFVQKPFRKAELARVMARVLSIT